MKWQEKTISVKKSWSAFLGSLKMVPFKRAQSHDHFGTTCVLRGPSDGRKRSLSANFNITWEKVWGSRDCNKTTLLTKIQLDLSLAESSSSLSHILHAAKQKHLKVVTREIRSRHCPCSAHHMTYVIHYIITQLMSYPPHNQCGAHNISNVVTWPLHH